MKDIFLVIPELFRRTAGETPQHLTTAAPPRGLRVSETIRPTYRRAALCTKWDVPEDRHPDYKDGQQYMGRNTPEIEVKQCGVWVNHTIETGINLISMLLLIGVHTVNRGFPGTKRSA